MTSHHRVCEFSSIAIFKTKQSFGGYTRDYYTFSIDRKRSTEYFLTDEEAIVQAIAAKYTAPRGASGAGVGTAADWFMKMIGADRDLET